MVLKRKAMLAAAAAAVLTGPFLRAQAPAAPLPGTAPAGEVVVGSGNFSPMLQDLDKAIDFYGGLLGLTVPPPPASGQRPLNTDPNLLGMFGMPAAQLKFVTARIPGATVGVEMVEVRGLDKKAVHPKPQDGGAATLILLVRDIDAALAPLKKAGVAVITAGGQPIAAGAGARAVLVGDPDGHFVELLQPSPLPETTAPAGSNVIGARVRFAVADTEKTMRVYRDTLQMKPQTGEFSTGPMVDLMGLKGAQVRLTTLQVPGSPLQLEFVEVKGASAAPIHPNLQDPGATRLQLRLRDLDGTIAKMKAAGSTVVSSGGQPVTLNGGIKAVIMTDPNGIYLVMIQQAPPRA
jgi:predicted enzyme related to lactoylglutathione lyase